MDLITCHNISKAYRADFWARRKNPVLENITFNVHQGEVFGIIGPNGAGKSTLLKILLGFIKPDLGTAIIDQKSVNSPHPQFTLGYLPENPSLYPHLTPKEHLLFACKVGGLDPAEREHKIRQALTTVNMLDVTDKQIKKFSKGMVQRTAIAYAVVLNPKILILDEPMSGLDPLGRNLVIDIIQQLHEKGTTILFCSHILNDVERICDRISILNKGRLLETISTNALRESYNSTEGSTGKTPLEQYFLNKINEVNS